MNVRAALAFLLATFLFTACGGDGSDASTPGTDSIPGFDSGPPPGTDAGIGPDGGFDDPTPLYFPSWTPRLDVITAGEPNIHFVIDTGSPVTVLDTDYFPGGPGTASVNMQMFGTTYSGVGAVRYDWFGPVPSGALLTVAGNVGSGFFLDKALVIDYRNAWGYVYSSLSGNANVQAATGPATVVSFTVEGGGDFAIPGSGTVVTVSATRVVFNGTVEGSPVRIMLDTGAAASVIREGFYNNLGGGGRPVLDGVNVSTSGGIVQGYLSRVSTIDVGGATVNGESVLIIPGTNLFSGLSGEIGGANIDLLLGGTYLRHFLTTVNYPANELRLARFSSGNHIDPDEWVKPGFDVRESDTGGFIISDVYAGTDAESAGLMEGLDITSINGMNISSMTLGQVRSLLTSFSVGNVVTVEVSIGMFTMDFPVMVEDLLPAYP